MVFIDHDKTCYLQDLKTLEQHGLVGSGTVVAADNVLSFGIPITDYLEYVRDDCGPFCSSICHQSQIEYVDDKTSEAMPIIDALEISVYR
jgi:predicted O-methyltransferase YrrM